MLASCKQPPTTDVTSLSATLKEGADCVLANLDTAIRNGLQTLTTIMIPNFATTRRPSMALVQLKCTVGKPMFAGALGSQKLPPF